MKYLPPKWWLKAAWSLPILARPDLVVREVEETPEPEELQSGVVCVEIRGGYLKWVHMRCPRCNDHIELPMVGDKAWRLRVDYLGRPTLSPSVWETEGCGAHFIVRKGRIHWCHGRDFERE